MGAIDSAARNVKIKITSADISGALKNLTEKGIILYDISYQNDLTAFAAIKRNHLKQTQRILHKRGDQCDLRDQYGVYGFTYHLKRRYVIILGIIVLLFLTVYIPSRIFFIEIKGNERISTQYIADKIIENGIVFGCERRSIRSEQIKNRILEDIPQLDWVGVTTAGCVATVEVKEKEPADIQEGKKFCNMISAIDGVVESVTVTRGKALCAPGQAVRSGQILISGYVDQGLIIKATGAEGEVYGKTFRKIEAVSPAAYAFREEASNSKTRYYLQVGKNIIFFSKHSSISSSSCGKMYSKRYLTLPGGFILPVAIVREETVYYETYDDTVTENDFALLDCASKKYLFEQMIAGEILNYTTDYELTDRLCILSGSYVCREQLGKYKFEENPLNYGKDS